MKSNSVNIDNWVRKSTYGYYRDFQDPFFNVTAPVDITGLVAKCKKENLSLSLSLIYNTLQAANEISNFRMRFDGAGLKIYDKIEAGSTILFEDESFGFAYYSNEEDIYTFNNEAQREIEKLKANRAFNPSDDRDDLIYFSSLPWISFTGLKHAQDPKVNGSIPKISFGKYYTVNDKVLIPTNVEVNHAIMDGLHLGKFFQKFEEINLLS